VVRRVLLFLLALAGLCLLWEGYKAFGQAVDGKIFGWELPARTDDSSMPHVWDMVSRFGDPEVRGSDRTVGVAVVSGAWFTFRMAFAGFVFGVLVGMLLAVVMQRFRVVERGLLPYVVLSQTVPLVALAPLVASWGGQLELFGVQWQPWMSVSAIAGYLAFFPVSVGALRGLQSPSNESVELMDSYAAGWWPTLTKLRFPSSVPFLIPAFRLAAAAAVVGAIVGEISTSMRGGLGRLIIEYSREATSDPAKVYTAMIASASLGPAAAGLVALFELVAMRNRPKGVVS